MRLSSKQKMVVNHLKEGWIMKILVNGGDKASVNWLYKESSAPFNITGRTVYSLKQKGFLRMIPSERPDEKWYELDPDGEKEFMRQKELMRLDIPAF